MTNVCELVVPSEQFRDSYSSYIAELEKHGEKRIPFPLRYPHEDFPGLLLRLKNDAPVIKYHHLFFIKPRTDRTTSSD